MAEAIDGPIQLRARTILVVVLMVEAMLLLLHLLSRWEVVGGDTLIRPHEFLDLDAEISVPTWFQQVQLAGAALLCVLVGAVRRRRGDADARRWTALGVIFGYLSLDEGTQLHEGLIDPMQNAFDIDSGPLLFAWVIPGAAAVIVFGVLYFRFWLALPSRPRLLIGIGGALFLLGALGMEMVSGTHKSDIGTDGTYPLVTGVEETLEMVGTSLFAYGVLLVLVGTQPTDGIRLRAVDT